MLAGGQGTRLRQLTYTTPKPVMPLAGRPFLTFMLDWLRGHGVDEAILSCGFMSDGVRSVLGDVYGGMRLRYVIEDEPLGTAGPVRLALDEGVLEERLLVLNGDVLTDLDLTAELDQHVQTEARCTLALIEVNELQKRRAVRKLQKHLGSLVGKEVALLGVSFKPDTDDVREATSLVLAARLQGEGANVRVYDPVALDNAEDLLGGAQICGSALEALDGADAAVLVTEWPEFAELDWAGEVHGRMAQPVIVDGRNFLDREALRAAGFTYEGIGR